MKRMLKSVLFASILMSVIVNAVKGQEPGRPIAELQLLIAKSEKDTSRVNLLLQLSESYFLNSARTQSNLQIAMVNAQSAEALSIELNYQRGLGNSYEQESKIYHVNHDTVKGKFLADKAIEIFKTNSFLMDLGEAYYDRAGYYSIYGNELTKRINIVEMSLAAFQQAGSKIKEGHVMKELGDLHQVHGDDLRALAYLRKALKIYQSIGYPKLHGTYDLLGVISTNLGDFEGGLKYGLLAVQIAEQVKDTSLQVATIYNRIGITYEKMKKYEQAYQYWQRSLSIAQKYNDNDAIIQLTCNLSKILVQLDKPDESLITLQKISGKYPVNNDFLRTLVASRYLITYKDLKQYERAQIYCDQLLRLSERFDQNDPNQSMVYESVIQLYIATGQIALARKYLAVNEAYCVRRQLPLGLSRNYLWRFKTDSIQGDYMPAIACYQRYKAIGDSLLNEATSKQIEQLQIVFETERKDQDIVLKEQNIQLLTKHGELQHSELQQEKFTKNITLVVIALLLIIVALLYNHSRHRLKSHQKLEDQQKEIQKKNLSLQHLVKEKDWLVKEIHHRVKNNFHIVMGLLGTQSGYLKNEEAIHAMGDSQHRVHAMSLIHQKLYQSDNLSAINMADYIHELVDYLRDSFNIRQSIRFSLQVERVDLDLSYSIPIGLILNEAITNSIKYAFGDDREGIVSISLSHTPEEHFLLTIADNGLGLPPGFDLAKSNSMGMNLMQGLSEDIGGKFSIENRNGTVISIAFYNDPELAVGVRQQTFN